MFKKIKIWYQLAETKKSLIFLQILFTSLRVVTWIVSPIFAAKVTVSLMDGEYMQAILNLGVELAVIFLGFVSWDQVYRNSGRIFRNTYMNVQRKIYKKAYRAKTSNFKVTSKEKLLNIIGTDIDVVAAFGDTLGVRIGRVIQVAVTLAIVFGANIVVGFAILCVSALNFVFLYLINKRIARKKSIVYESKDKIYEKFSQVLSDQDVIKEFDMGPEYANSYFERADNYAKDWSRHKNSVSIKDNYFVAFYKVLIFIITVFMIFLVKNGVLDLTLYFTLVSYLLSTIELINEIINISASIEETDVSTKRINTIINFTDEEFVKYGTITQYAHSDNFTFMNVSYKNTDTESPFYGELKNVDMSFKYGVLNLVKGERYCGKRVVFNLMSRRIMPSSGVIMMNDINIYDYDKSAYKAEVFNAFSKPKFIDDSIEKNFGVSESNSEKIRETCELFGILDFIESLPKKMDTNINDAKLNPFKAFLFGLAMSYLQNSSMLCIYEIPEGLTAKEYKKLQDIIALISTKTTIVIFTHSDLFDDMAGLIYTMKKGEIIDRIEK